jgi:hypothetical protein
MSTLVGLSVKVRMLKQKETRKDLHLEFIKKEQRGEDIEEDLSDDEKVCGSGEDKFALCNHHQWWRSGSRREQVLSCNTIFSSQHAWRSNGRDESGPKRAVLSI